ncbi:MAG: hypothetical protein ABWK01_06680, partial [Infirmifilum sp.]
PKEARTSGTVAVQPTGTVVRQAIPSVEELEKELSNYIEALNKLEQRKARGEVPDAVYSRLKDEYEKAVERIKSEIEKYKD